MLSPMMKIKLLQLASKYGIQILEFRPGYVQVHITNWSKYEQQLGKMIEKLKQFPEIKAVQLSHYPNTVSIYYDETMFETKSQIKYWFNILENEILI